MNQQSYWCSGKSEAYVEYKEVENRKQNTTPNYLRLQCIAICTRDVDTKGSRQEEVIDI